MVSTNRLIVTIALLFSKFFLEVVSLEIVFVIPDPSVISSISSRESLNVVSVYVSLSSIVLLIKGSKLTVFTIGLSPSFFSISSVIIGFNSDISELIFLHTGSSSTVFPFK